MAIKSLNKYFYFVSSILTSIINGNFLLFRFYCPSCNSKNFFIKAGLDNHLTKCLSCRSSIISLSVLLVLHKHNDQIKYLRTYELSFHGVIFDYLKMKSENFVFSEYFPFTNDTYVDGIRNEDVQKLSFKRNSFDLVTSTEVMEHVPNYRKGLEEICRVLDRDGYFIFTIPLYGRSKTIQIAKLNKQKKIVWLGKPEFHGSRLCGGNSVPVFWHHSKIQIIKELYLSGFSKVIIDEIDWGNNIKQLVIVARK